MSREQIDKEFSKQSNTLNVDLSKLGMTHHDFSYIVTKPTNKVQNLCLGNNKLNRFSMMEMSRAKWDGTVNLYLNTNEIGDKGCKYLSRILLPKIKHISLLENNISSTGAFYLSLAQWKTIQCIVLSSNRIGPDGTKHVTKARWNPKIKKLYIMRNEIQIDGVIACILCDFCYLYCIDLRFNKGQPGWKMKEFMKQRFISIDHIWL